MRILVTAGPTREYFDTVRFISNPSTGKQGYAIAQVACQRGHEVVLVSGPVQIPVPAGLRVEHVVSAEEMARASKAAFDDCDAAVMTAAVCDYRPPVRLDRKLRKHQQHFEIALEPTEDICAALGHIKAGRVVVGFAMNDHDATAQAERKLKEKHCDYIVLNGLANVGADDVEVQILSAVEGWRPAISGSKIAVAEHLIELIESHF
jgi:phosphopantothenoylcysteine decarboxylase/phosphopantothenate--cysteine ligase